MNLDKLVAQVIEDDSPAFAATAVLSDEVAAVVVERLKQEADRFWRINANRSLELADRIVAIGQLRADQRIEALGIMARADALKLLGRHVEAWAAFEESGALFMTVDDEVG